MKNEQAVHSSMAAKSRMPQSRQSGERGSALVITLLLLTLLSAATVGMVISASSDELISGYNRNMRSSFYAADSGLNVVRQATLNQLAAAVPASITNRAVQPIAVGAENTIRTAINAAYASYTSMNSGQAANSWPGKYQVTLDPITRACQPQGTDNAAAGIDVTNNCATPCTGTNCAANITGYNYSFTYNLTALGQSLASEQTTLTDSGSLLVNVVFSPPAGTVTSFANYGFFVDHNGICDGSYLVPGTITGPVFSNEAWNFGVSNTSYIFTDTVGAVNANFGYQFSGTCKQLSTSSATNGSSSISPTFQSGYQLGQNSVPLPGNSYSQKQAVLDGKGAPPACATAGTTPCPPMSAMGAQLKNVSGSSYPSSGSAPSSGVYLPYTNSGSGCPCINGGGIYIEGNATVTLSTIGTAPYLGQVTTIVQGSTTTTVTTYPNGFSSTSTGAQTKFVSGSTSQTITGVPNQYDSVSAAYVRDATMVYVNGDITSLKGPGSGGAAIQDGAAMSVVAAGDITLTDDILYKTKPVTTTQSGSTPPSTLISGNDSGQVLGIFTSTGDIQLANCSGCGNMEIDAALATISTGGTGGLINTGSQIDTLTILGGRIQNYVKNINSNTRNVIFDRRFSSGFAPPWFPSTTITPTGTSTQNSTASVQRVQWLNKTPF